MAPLNESLIEINTPGMNESEMTIKPIFIIESSISIRARLINESFR